MRKLFFIALIPFFCSALIPVHDGDKESKAKVESQEFSPLAVLQEQYKKLGIEDVICFDAFSKAYQGYNKIPQVNRQILTLIDFTKPSNQQRLAVIDMEKGEVLFKSLVAHGRNSGDRYAKSFSNVNGSHKSSLGFYLTGTTYNGKNGYSLKLIGLEKNFNDKAYERAIVIHGATYCDPSIISHGARLGRSLGCPALPPQLSVPIINTIKGGTILFIYAQDRNYLAGSPLIGDRVESRS